ncbi:MAG: ABC transporter substrate-binding protein [Gammaproteobacteria bacterium]|nr:ABC transporter substrate-binding protein [Gammaproteobacteria bacterium]MDH5800706.1 ABC transporter substrate-binding protein [Gammaproteobacteria bacterium]
MNVGLNNIIAAIPAPWKFTFGTIAWFVLISVLHFKINVDEGERQVISMGYMPVISNMAAPILDQASKENGKYRFKALKFSSFAEMAEALRNGEIHAAFMIAPLSIVLHQQGESIKVVLFGNGNESTLVTRKGLNIKSLHDLRGKQVAVPMRYSGHNLSILELINKNGLEGEIKVVEMNPPDMASALASGVLDAYYVGEPFAIKTLKSGDSELLFYAEDVWPHFFSNLTLVKQDFINKDPAAVKALVHGAVRAVQWAKRNQTQAAKISSKYWNQPLELVTYALENPPNRTNFDRYVPQMDEMRKIVRLMKQFGLTDSIDVEGVVDDSFARQAPLDNITTIESVLKQ